MICAEPGMPIKLCNVEQVVKELEVYLQLIIRSVRSQDMFVLFDNEVHTISFFPNPKN